MSGGLTVIFVFHYLWLPALFALAHAENWGGEGCWREKWILILGWCWWPVWGQFISCCVAIPSGSQHVSSHPYSIAQLCLTLCDPMDYRPPGSSVYGIFQARILQGLSFPPPEGSSWSKPMSPALQSCIGRQILTTEPPGKLPQSLNLWINTSGCPPISRS